MSADTLLGPLPAEALAPALSPLLESRQGTDHVELFLSRQDRLTLELEPQDGRPRESRGVELSAAVRLRSEGRVGTASGPVQSARDVEALLDRAHRESGHGPPASAEPPALPEVSENRVIPLTPGGPDFRRAAACADALRRSASSLAAPLQALWLQEELQDVLLLRSGMPPLVGARERLQGLLRVETPRGAVMDGGLSSSFSVPWETWPIHSRLEAAVAALAELGHPPDRKLPWLLAPSVAAPLAMGLSLLLRGDVAASQPALLRAVGKQAFPSALTVRDATGAGGLPSCPWDDEGHPVAPLTLVEAGTLRAFLHTRATAAQVGHPANGRAQRASASLQPIPSAWGFHFGPGDMDVPADHVELVARLETFTVQPRAGVVRMVVAGWEVRGGQRHQRVAPFELELPVMATLKRVVGTGRNITFFPALDGCGSPALLLSPAA